MAKRPNLTRAEIDRIVTLRIEKGWSQARIAQSIGCSLGSVSWALLREGAERAGHTPIVTSIPSEATTYIRNGRPIRRFTEADDKVLLEAEAEGLTPTAIGRRFTPPRLPNTITGRLRTLARREARLEALDGALP